MDINKIIQESKKYANWSANGKYNYGPIHHFSRMVFKDYHEGRESIVQCFKTFYANIRQVTDAETFFVSEFLRFDIYVRCSDLVYVMRQAFPEIPESKVWEWIEEHKDYHHVLVR